MDTDNIPDVFAHGELFTSFIEPVNVEAQKVNLIACNKSIDCLSIILFMEEKLNKIPQIIFLDESKKNEVMQNYSIFIEEARAKYTNLKQDEIKSELAQLSNLCQSWGMANPNIIQNQTPMKLRI
ncbi:hypothetical protein NPIL_663031 [Nephila pilipes]|uniref:Uncharacterized protein n=1 Tax=Nephila pilipes TaxID=299642 RepID=A0A8X6TJ85_NEPPI|nr:hypothetical protein NPIL_614221 [Nephila pilipes]GFT15513.1 hypothetical protein NPIL_424761 [Nephila pilipes]GFU23793.1 hypothetical protein NPIL_668031 [Nephila pilipes]GFU49613.1 hypothetical protein NPIL_663031 [Nephila pilipes]